MEWVDKAKYIFQITCMFCKENRKIVSTFVLFLITLVIIVIGVVLHIPSDVDKNSFTPRPPLFSNIKFTPFSLNVSQLEFLLSTCEYYACIEDTCYCKTAEKFTWHQAKETCENSGLPNAAMFKPLTVRHGVFHTYKNLLTFLTNSGGYHKPLWTSLHREKEGEAWLDEKNETSQFHLFDRQGDGNDEPYCVQKITSRGWAVTECSTSTSYNLPDEFTPDIYNEGKSALDQLSWDDKYWNGVNVPNRILCEINLEDTQFWTDDKQQDLDDFFSKNTNYKPSGDSRKQYYISSGTNRRFTGRKTRLLESSGCYIDHLNVQYDGRRAVLTNKEEEQFILESIPEIFIEIGLSKELESGHEVFKWDWDANAMEPSYMKWYYPDSVRSGLNCLRSQAYSQHNLQLDWEAAKCNDVAETVCTFSVPRAPKKQKVAMYSTIARIIRNIYSSYFCIDDDRKKCYVSATLPFDEALHFARMNRLTLAVISNDDKNKVAEKIRPQIGVYVGATSILRGKHEFSWMYTNQSVVFFKDEKERLENIDSWRDLCLILASNGEYYAAICDEGISTLIEVKQESDFLIVERGNFWY